MHTSIAVLAVVGSFASANVRDVPVWQNEYRQARLKAAGDQKPLAVFVGSGKSGWAGVTPDGANDRRANELLASRYVCLYVDTDTAAGRKLAASFELAGGGLVISDRTGESQAFSHRGKLDREQLVRALERYSDPNHVVKATETNVPVAAAPQPVAAPVYQPAYQPIMAPPFGGYGGFPGYGMPSFGGG